MSREIFGTWNFLKFFVKSFLIARCNSSCPWHQNFEYKCSGYSGNEADYGRFGVIFDIFQAAHCGSSLKSRTPICLRKFSLIYVLSRAVSYFLMTLGPELEINTLQIRFSQSLGSGLVLIKYRFRFYLSEWLETWSVSRYR